MLDKSSALPISDQMPVKEYFEFRFDRLEKKVDALAKLSKRVDKLESVVVVARWLGIALSSIVLALVIAYLGKALGI